MTVVDELAAMTVEQELENQQIARRLRALADDLCREVRAAEVVHTPQPTTSRTRRALIEEAGLRAIKRINSTLGLPDTAEVITTSDRRRLCEVQVELDKLATNISCYLG